MDSAKKKKIRIKGKILSRIDPGVDIPITFHCKRCGTPISKPVRQLAWTPDTDDLESEVPRVAQGFYFVEQGDYVLNLADLDNTLQLPDMGCCGQSGIAGRNVTCAQRHEVATEHSDCCYPHDAVLDKDRVSPVTQYDK